MAMQGARRFEASTAASRGAEDRGQRERDRWTPRPPRRTDTERLADALGWFSVGAGLAALVASRPVARAIGLAGGASRPVLRLVGLREVASGLGVLGSREPAGWLGARVAGDVMDLALLGLALGSRRARRGRLGATAAAVVGVMALDVLAARELGRRDGARRGLPPHHAVAARKSVTVGQPAEALYTFWRDFTNLPRFMRRLESVRLIGERRSHWRARGVAGIPVEWDAEVIEDRLNELIAWRSMPGSPLDHSGSVRFGRAPGGRGTTVTVEIEYTPRAGMLGARVAWLLGQAPEQQLQEDLRRFKQLMETGEITVSDGALLGAAQPVGALPSVPAEAGEQR